MSLGRLWSALKGHTNKALEDAADSQAITILDQQIREAKKEIQQCGQSLHSIAAKRKLSQNKVASLQADIDKYSQSAAEHAETNRELALECAQRVGELEQLKASEQNITDSYVKNENTLKSNLATAKNNLRMLEQQVDQVKATESVQKAQVAASTHFSGGNSKVKTALDSLERIKQKQAEKDAALDAASELAELETGSDLDAKIRQAGGGANNSSEDMLAKILAGKK
ncbi:PspA/IM30 family protein [Agaribacter marinus]|uniref:Phage shock protein A n=1 Tax=Agaribacter marinus TaxID=1431249 RepID=A0AA37T5J2_9ALTE|nr:PspA/IM30 family protein [Agaribacter marinus]GLR71920.1 phage shock protein A [Agaribacter marinus]